MTSEGKSFGVYNQFDFFMFKKLTIGTFQFLHHDSLNANLVPADDRKVFRAYGTKLLDQEEHKTTFSDNGAFPNHIETGCFNFFYTIRLVYNQESGTFLRLKFKVNVNPIILLIKIKTKNTDITLDLQEIDSNTSLAVSTADPRTINFTTEEQAKMNLKDGDVITMGVYLRIWIIPEPSANTKGTVVDVTVFFKGGIVKSLARTLSFMSIKSGEYELKFVNRGYAEVMVQSMNFDFLGGVYNSTDSMTTFIRDVNQKESVVWCQNSDEFPGKNLEKCEKCPMVKDSKGNEVQCTSCYNGQCLECPEGTAIDALKHTCDFSFENCPKINYYSYKDGDKYKECTACNPETCKKQPVLTVSRF